MVEVNKRYRLKIVQAYAPTASYEDEAADSFHEVVESAMNKRTAQFTIVMGDFNAKVGANRIGEVVGNLGIGTCNSAGDALVGFAEKNNLKLMNAFFRKRTSRKWTWKGPDEMTKKN